jgi:putative ABC transport system permease protein
MFIMLDDAQRLIFGGAPSATAILTRGTPSAVPDDVRVVSPAQARSDLKRPLANAVRTIDLFRLILWIVAATVIGSVLYISALERSRDFAVFKAFGTDSSDLVAGLIFEALVIAAISGGAAVLAADGLTRLFPAVISVPASLLALLGIAALSAGVLGGIAGARRAVTVEPSLAFSSQ